MWMSLKKHGDPLTTTTHDHGDAHAGIFRNYLVLPCRSVPYVSCTPHGNLLDKNLKPKSLYFL
jgi:hypothetical protein